MKTENDREKTGERVATEAPGLLCRHDEVDWSDPQVRLGMARRRAEGRAALPAVDRPEPLMRAFVETLVFLYDRRVYDAASGRWRVAEFLDAGEREFGGFDQVILWPSYPRLGVDRRDQFDYYRDLPAGPDGQDAAAHWVERCHRRGVRVLLAYNPWDRNTRPGDRHLADMVDLLERTGADGVYLDTMEHLPAGWAEAMARLGRPVAFETEGDPKPAAMRRIHSSWGQGYVIHPPTQIYRTRWLLPQHKIFLTSHRHSRDHWNEVRAAFFAGAGVLVWENVFGNDTSWVERDTQLLRALLPILRTFWRSFLAEDWEPFVPSGHPRLSANRFPGPDGTLYTLCWNEARPYDGPLFAAADGRTYVDLITGKALAVRGGQVVGRLAGRSVGAVLEVDRLTAALRERIAAAAPGALPAFVEVDTSRLDPPDKPQPRPRLNRYRGVRPARLPAGMAWVPPGRFRMRIDHPWHGSTCYPHHRWPKEGRLVRMPGFAIDVYPVTNEQFAAFLRASGYQPAEKRNFLRHWKDGRAPPRLEKHPVVWVSLADARAYAKWAGKRLPTEAEWQYAGQGADGTAGGRAWPWGEEFDPNRVNGTGGTRPVGACLGDASPVGVRDMVGHVWQWVDDLYADEMNRFTVLKGGSFWRLPPGASRWYLHTGPLALTGHVKVALLADSLDRFGTVGFRCVID